MRQIRPLEGTVQLHENAKILYFSQLHETLDTTKSIIENFAIHGLIYTAERVGGVIENYGFAFADKDKLVS